MKALTTIVYSVFAIFAVAWVGPLPIAHAVSPPPDGGYPGQNTAEGQSALLHLAGGSYNTALGWSSVGVDVTGNLNTAVGAGALLFNTADQNTATGAGALLSDTTGGFNTATGALALFSNAQGDGNTANGNSALKNSTTGNNNTATGYAALVADITGADKTANGTFALFGNAMGSNNVALGFEAGFNATGSNNIYIGAGIQGFASDNGVCRIGSIYGATITNGTQVVINSDNRLGTITCSKRFKQNIRPTSSASEVLYELQPVRFQYKKEIDPEGRWQFGLVAEDVEKVNPDLVVRDKEGKPCGVRYDQVNAMLLNEFLKEHRKVERLEAAVAQQRKDSVASTKEHEREIRALTSIVKEQTVEIQRVRDNLERREAHL